jgi:hypothetical protein
MGYRHHYTFLGALFCALALFSPARAQDVDPVTQAAAPYAAFRADIAALSQETFAKPGDLEAALERIGRYNADDLSRGWIAYGALSAAKSPAFAAGVSSVTTRYGRAAVLKALTRDPAYPSRRRGYGEAIGLTLDIAFADSSAASAAAAHIDAIAAKPLAWANADTAETRAASLRALGAAPGAPFAMAAAPTLPLHLARLRTAPGQTATPRRMASLAAMKLLDARGDWRASINAMLNDKPTRDCVRMQQLQLYQCVSVTHEAGEAAQCLSEHGMRGINSCMGAIVAR